MFGWLGWNNQYFEKLAEVGLVKKFQSEDAAKNNK